MGVRVCSAFVTSVSGANHSTITPTIVKVHAIKIAIPPAATCTPGKKPPVCVLSKAIVRIREPTIFHYKDLGEAIILIMHKFRHALVLSPRARMPRSRSPRRAVNVASQKA